MNAPGVIGSARLTPPGRVDVRIGSLDAHWDSQLAQYPQASVFHTVAWLRVLQSCYGFAPVCLSADHRECPPSRLLLMEVRSLLSGCRAVALPFTDVCEPLCNDPDALNLLFGEAIGLGKSRGWKYIELRGGAALLAKNQPSLRFYGHSVNLIGSESGLFARLHASVQRAVRKAQKNHLTVSASQSLEAVDEYYKLHCDTRRKHGLPPQPLAFFHAIHREIIAPGNGIAFLAYSEGRPIAGAIFLLFGRQAVYKLGASDPRQLDSRGNTFVMWEAIRWLRDQGFQSLHLGRTSLASEGLRRYKLHFGAVEHDIDYVRFDLRLERFISGADHSHGLHTHFFRLLPKPLSRLAGQILYRHMA